MSAPKSSDYDVLTFDCYGTLVDWEKALTQYLQPVLLAHDVHVYDGTILEFFAEWEPLEQNEGGSYREVLQRVMTRYGSRLGFTPNQEETNGFVECIARADPFSDTVEALQALHEHFELGIISNTDSDLIALTMPNLQVNFKYVQTAEDLGAYKPNLDAMKSAFDSILTNDKRVLHVAQSKFHDSAPATELGFDTVWIQRQVETTSAVKSVPATPTWSYLDLAEFTHVITSTVAAKEV